MTDLQTAFVLHFGEMGSRWGFNRTVGQIYALLVLSENALTANDLADKLGISRGNVSMAIKELNSWGLIKVSHKPQDRKEYYQPAGDMTAMALQVIEQRKKREIEPTLSLIRDQLFTPAKTKEDAYAQQQMQAIHDLLETFLTVLHELQKLSPEQIALLLSLGDKLTKVLNLPNLLKKKRLPDEDQS